MSICKLLIPIMVFLIVLFYKGINNELNRIQREANSKLNK